ncbi:TATA box-binding protein-associated factor RNA polymerase I subunit B [Osmerus mordax]|uniref:TATA box-binding protein-associated factor RNA polymerase I subunit B n=1 Tax=Osmerus mordax TaxID=8014 RepID=UPI00350F83DD
MDEEETGGYREPCSMCAAVDWGISDEGRFYCKSCHNVIERTREVVDTSTLMMGCSRISSISKSSKTKKLEHGWEWMVCEGFQFILKHQAEALLDLGVCSYFKDDVLCKFWRMYLQKSRQAYTNDPVSTSKFKVRTQDSESDSAPESSVWSVSETEELGWSSGAGSAAENLSDGLSVTSGSVDASFYLTPHQRKSPRMMSMPKTLALCYLALLWAREAFTLADLLRLVSEGCIPYVNAHEGFPEEMRLYGRDALIFRVESIPSHRALHKEACSLAVFLDLPPFPPITQDCLLHPSLLTIRYLTEVNLPDEVQDFVCRVIEQAGMEDEALHSFKPMKSRCVLPLYDVQAAALILVTMKLLFKLDDRREWDLANTASDMNKETPGENCFNVRKWYKMVESALTRARQRQEENIARKHWKSQKVLYTSKKYKTVVLKRRRVAEQLQMTFQKLSGSSPSPPPSSPSSFCFCWGEEDEEHGAVDGPSLHQQNLGSLVVLRDGELQPSNPTYWHPSLRVCQDRGCRSHYDEVEDTLPKMFVWLLQLFSFILNVQPSCVYEEVLKVERRFLRKNPKLK